MNKVKNLSKNSLKKKLFEMAKEGSIEYREFMFLIESIDKNKKQI